MNKYIYSVAILMLPYFSWAQLISVQSGLTVNISSGTQVSYNNGSLTIQNNSTLENNGLLNIGNNFTQNTGATYAGGTSGWMEFNGTANQSISGDATVMVAKLRANNGSSIILNTNLTVSDSLDLAFNGNIELGMNDLTMTSGASILNYDEFNYIRTNQGGSLIQEVGTNDVVFPVGNSSYNPVVLNNTGTLDNFMVQAMDSVFNNGLSGTPYTQDAVNRSWNIEEQVTGGSNASLTVQWDLVDELPSFDYLNCGIAQHELCGLCTWVAPLSYSAAVANGAFWIQTRTGLSSFGAFSVTDMDLLSVDHVSQKGEDLNITVFPNPTEDFINIRLGEMEAQEMVVRIFAINGQLLLEEGFAISGNEVLALEQTKDFPAGTYTVQMVLNNGKNLTKKFIKSIH